MPARKSLDQMLSGETLQPTIRRGQGLRLSTESSPDVDVPSDSTQDITGRTNALTHQRTNAMEAPRRVNRGYKLREDLVKACKRIALDEDRLLYEVMEEALELYIKQKAQKSKVS